MFIIKHQLDTKYLQGDLLITFKHKISKYYWNYRESKLKI